MLRAKTVALEMHATTTTRALLEHAKLMIPPKERRNAIAHVAAAE